jgi:hypothetical protein
MKTAIAMIAIIAASLSGDAMAAQPTPAEIAAAHTKLLELYKTLPNSFVISNPSCDLSSLGITRHTHEQGIF